MHLVQEQLGALVGKIRGKWQSGGVHEACNKRLKQKRQQPNWEHYLQTEPRTRLESGHDGRGLSHETEGGVP